MVEEEGPSPEDLGITTDQKDEKEDPDWLPKQIVGEVDEWFSSGECNKVFKNYDETKNTNREPGGREDFCGPACTRVLEIVQKVNKENPNISARSFQSEHLHQAGKKINADVIFRKHRFVILYDTSKGSESWWIIDPTFSQFVTQDKDNVPIVNDIKIPLKETTEDSPSSVAHKIIKDGYVKASPKVLASYVTLLARGKGSYRPSPETTDFNNMFEKLTDHLEEKPYGNLKNMSDFIERLQRNSGDKEMETDEWNTFIFNLKTGRC